jgi:hypothetical protein
MYYKLKDDKLEEEVSLSDHRYKYMDPLTQKEDDSHLKDMIF